MKNDASTKAEKKRTAFKANMDVNSVGCFMLVQYLAVFMRMGKHLKDVLGLNDPHI